MKPCPQDLWRCLLVLSFWSPALVAADPAVSPSLRLVPLDGEPFQAGLQSLQADWSCVFQTPDSTRTISADSIASWGSYHDSYEHMHVVLADGSVVVAEVLAIQDEKLTIDGDISGRTDLPLSQVRGIVFDPPFSAEERDRLRAKLAGVQATRDQLFLDNGDVVDGFVKALQEPASSGTSAQPLLTFETQGRDLQIPLDKAVAVAFNPALADPPKPPSLHVLMSFRDGSLLDVARVEPGDAFTRVTTVGGTSLDVDSLLIRTELTFLLPFSPRVAYVSDLEPVSYKHIAFLETSRPMARDQSLGGRRLRSAGRVYPKGLAMPAASRVAYDLNGGYRRFEAELAIDEETGLGGSAVFRVFLRPPSGTWNRIYESPVVRGGDAPRPISVDVSGATGIALLVDFAERGDVLDHADWLLARLVK